MQYSVMRMKLSKLEQKITSVLLSMLSHIDYTPSISIPIMWKECDRGYVAFIVLGISIENLPSFTIIISQVQIEHHCCIAPSFCGPSSPFTILNINTINFAMNYGLYFRLGLSHFLSVSNASKRKQKVILFRNASHSALCASTFAFAHNLHINWHGGCCGCTYLSGNDAYPFVISHFVVNFVPFSHARP